MSRADQRHLNTRQTSILITQPANDWIVTALIWTPDGKGLIIGVGSNISGRPYRFERVTVADRKTSPVGDAFHAYPRSFTWTADGSTLAVVLNPSIDGKLGPGEIWLVDSTNGKRRQLKTNGAFSPTSIHASSAR